MSWEHSQRRSELPPDWAKRRHRALQRDNFICVVEGCREPATDVDHIERGNNHSLENLQSLCSWHHRRKTGSEGNAAYWAAIKKNDKRFRRTEQHPGLI